MSEKAYYEQKNLIGCIVNTIYDIQKERISFGNRVFSVISPELEEENKEDEKKKEKSFNIILKEYRLIDKLIVENNLTKKKFFQNKEFTKDHIIKDELLYDLVSNYNELLKIENGLIKSLERELKRIPVYKEFLVNIKGIGPLMSGVIVAYLDIYKANYPSSFLRYIGIDVVRVEDKDGNVTYEGRSKKHTVMKEYIDKNGKKSEKVSITFKPFLKTKIIGVLAASFIKSKSDYTVYYYAKKEELSNNRNDELTPLHIDNMAKRYMIKKFIIDLWVNWREIEGLPITTQKYEEKKS